MLVKVINKLLGITVSLCVLCTSLTVSAKSTYDVPNNSEFKAFMDYRTITSVNSKQYKLQENCVTNEDGVRLYDGRYTVAIGTGFDADVGTHIDVHLSTGKTLKCVVGDIKRNRDTDATNMQVSHNGNIVEFIVDTDKLPSCVIRDGTLSSLENFSGYVDKITKYNEEDMQDIVWNFDSNQTCSGTERLVLDKYTIAVGDAVLYIVEYESNDDYNTIEVDVDTFNNLIVNESIISIE